MVELRLKMSNTGRAAGGAIKRGAAQCSRFPIYLLQ